MQSHSEIIAKLQAAETTDTLADLFKNPAFCEVYPLLRQKVVGENTAAMVGQSAGFQRKGRLASLADILRHELNPVNFRRKHPVDLLFLSYSTSRLFGLPKGWPDVYAEPFLKTAEARGLRGDILEVPAAGEYRMPRLRPGHLIGLDEIRARVWSKLRPVAPVLRYEVEACRQVFLKQGLIAESIAPAHWPALWSYFSHRRAIFTRQLRRLKPKLAIVINWYGTTCMALTSAAQGLGIPAADLQHGAQGLDDSIYGPWETPPTFSTMMPCGWLNWTVHDKANLETWLGPHQRSYVCGIPWHQLASDLLADSVDFDVLKEAAGTRPIVLVSLQPNSTPLLDYLQKVLAQPGADQFSWAVRCHPGNVNQIDQVAARFAGNANVLPVWAATFVPLSMVLSISAAHLSVFSSVVLEAAASNVPSVLSEDFGQVFFDHLGPDLLAVATDPAEMVPSIQALIARSKIASGVNDTASVAAAIDAIWQDVTEGRLTTQPPVEQRNHS